MIQHTDLKTSSQINIALGNNVIHTGLKISHLNLYYIVTISLCGETSYNAHNANPLFPERLWRSDHQWLIVALFREVCTKV